MMKLSENGVWGRRPSRDSVQGTTQGPGAELLASTRLAIEVTFLRLETRRSYTPIFPPDCTLGRVLAPSLSFYRYLYNTVGARHVWWLRRTMPDAELTHLLASPGVSIHVLTRNHEPAGFYELDARQGHTVNLSYFGLMPHTIGQGLGINLLYAALTAAWSHNPRAITVNTCTADHPRALPNYLAAGFTPTRTTREIWEVPKALGLAIPDALRV